MAGLPESVFFPLLSTDAYRSEWDKPLKKLEFLFTYLLIDAKTDPSISVIIPDYRFRYGYLSGISVEE
jgi:hypothetical protein